MIVRLCTIIILSFSMLLAQSFNKSKVDFRLWDDIDRAQSAAPKVLSKFFKSSGQLNIADVIIYSTNMSEAKSLGVEPIASYPQFFTARVSVDQILALSNLNSTIFIEAPKMRYPKLDSSRIDMKVNQVHSGQGLDKAYKGKGVIVGVIDTGIDWMHQDFRLDSDTTQSRILFILDETTGKEFTQAQINDELDGTPAGVVDEEDINGHGTHVASTAAGDGSSSSGKYIGVAPEADLIIVKGGDDGFSTTNIINGITYIRQKADSIGKPFVINMSLGGHDGSHDGTSAEEVAVDAELNGKSGRQIVIAAGNEGSDAIYGGATLAQSSSKVFKINIPAYTPNAGSVNDFVFFSMWYTQGDNFTVAVKTPNNTTVQAATGAQQTNATANGFVRVANNGLANAKGARECVIEIYDNSSATPPTADTTWTITVTAGSVPQGGKFDIWLAGTTMGAEFLSGHSFEKLVGMPGAAEQGITVGAYVTKWRWAAAGGGVFTYSNSTYRTNNFSTFSSMGPTRDGRQKPDISAPGQGIAAAMSGSTNPQAALQVAPAGKYVIEQGTSMASPHVAGLVALLLQGKPTLSSAQIKTALINSARTDAFVGAVPNAQWGYGKADAQAALQSVLSVRLESEAIPNQFALDQNYPNPFNPSTKISFSIPNEGDVTLKVYTVLGEEIATLVNEHIIAGEYSTLFDASKLSSGIYFYTLKVGTYVQTKKMMLIK